MKQTCALLAQALRVLALSEDDVVPETVKDFSWLDSCLCISIADCSRNVLRRAMISQGRKPLRTSCLSR